MPITEPATGYEEDPMSKLRYVKSPDELRLAAKFDPEFLPSSMRQIRALYETDPELLAAVLPPPLAPGTRPEIGVTISQVKMHMAPGFDVEIGAAIFGARAVLRGRRGHLHDHHAHDDRRRGRRRARDLRRAEEARRDRVRFRRRDGRRDGHAPRRTRTSSSGADAAPPVRPRASRSTRTATSASPRSRRGRASSSTLCSCASTGSTRSRRSSRSRAR